jgi:hypothetical protein
MPRLKATAILLLISGVLFVPSAQAQGGCPPPIVHCLPPPYAVPAEPVWATFDAIAGGNYPGGDQVFSVLVVNSDSPPLGNTTVSSETLSTPFENVTITGLPAVLASGQSLTTNVTVPIPRNFTQSSFMAHVVIHIHIANSTASSPTLLTGSAQVFVLGSPLAGAPSANITSAKQTTHLSAQLPILATLNALAYGNYPGGNEQFSVFVVNTDAPPLGNISLLNETLSAPALLPPNSNGAAGLPLLLTTGQGIASSIYLPIPSNFTRSSFTASLVVNLEVFNGTGYSSKQLTLSTTVPVLNLPGTVTPPSGSSSEVSSSTSTASLGSSELLYAGVVIVVLIAIGIGIALLARRRTPHA